MREFLKVLLQFIILCLVLSQSLQALLGPLKSVWFIFSFEHVWLIAALAHHILFVVNLLEVQGISRGEDFSFASLKGGIESSDI